jgi:hypothetical protein
MEIALTLVTGVVVALATSFFTSRFYVHQATTDLRNEYHRRFNEKKWEAYTRFAATVRDVVSGTKDGKLQREMPKVIGRLHDFISDLWLVGSDDVVKAVLKRRRFSQDTPNHPAGGAEALLSLADIMIAMRKDLGDTTTKIEARDILATFINDVDTAIPK